MNTDPAPKPVSKSALHRRRSSSGDIKNSPSVITDQDPTVNLSLSFSNLGDFAPQDHLDTSTKAKEHNKKNDITHVDVASTDDEPPCSTTDTIDVDAPGANTDDRDDDSVTKSLNLTLPDLVAASPGPREGSFPPIEEPKRTTKGGGITMRNPAFFTDPPPQEAPDQGDFEAFGDAEERDRQRSSPQRPLKAPSSRQGGGITMRGPNFFDPPPEETPTQGDIVAFGDSEARDELAPSPAVMPNETPLPQQPDIASPPPPHVHPNHQNEPSQHMCQSGGSGHPNPLQTAAAPTPSVPLPFPTRSPDGEPLRANRLSVVPAVGFVDKYSPLKSDTACGYRYIGSGADIHWYWDCHPPPLCTGVCPGKVGGPSPSRASSQGGATDFPMGQSQVTVASLGESYQAPKNMQPLGNFARSDDVVPCPSPSPAPSSLDPRAMDSVVTHGTLSPSDFPPLPLPSTPLPPPISPTPLHGAQTPFPPIVFPGPARAGLNFHTDQPHLFGECPGEPSHYERIVLMFFFDHTVVAVSPRVSGEGGARPPGFKVCGNTAIFFHGDALHATTLPDGFGGERRGIQFRGWTLKTDLDSFLEAKALGQGGGTNSPQLGDLLGAGVGTPGTWVGVGGSSDFLAASHLDEATVSLLRESFIAAREDPTLADSGRSSNRSLFSCGPSFNVARPADTSLPYRDFPPFALNLLEGLKVHMGAPPTFEVKGIFWQTFASSPKTGENPRCFLCRPSPPTPSPTGTPALSDVPAESPPNDQRVVHQPYAAALLATHSTQVDPPTPPAHFAPQVPRPEQRPHSSLVENVWGENLPPFPTDLRKRVDLRGHMAHGNFSRDMGTFAPPPNACAQLWAIAPWTIQIFTDDVQNSFGPQFLSAFQPPPPAPPPPLG